MKSNWSTRASIGRNWWLSGTFLVTPYWLKYQYHGARTLTLLDLTQNLVKSLFGGTKLTSPPWLLSKNSCCNLWPCFQAPSFCRKACWCVCRQGEMSCHHTHSEHALLLLWAVGQTEAVGMSPDVKENQTTQHSGSWLFNSYDFSASWVSLRRSRDVCEILGPHPAAAEEPQRFLMATGRRKGHWSETLGGGWGWTTWAEVCECWDKRPCDTGTVLLHG